MLSNLFFTLCLVLLSSFVTALPSMDHLSRRALERRQDAANSGLTDVDILQFALTLEHLEASFYREGFARFDDSSFRQLGFSADSIASLKRVGETEAIHVSTLIPAIAANNVAPVQECKYEFGFTDASSMLATARILELVGTSAYLGAAPLVSSPAILGVAGSILTVEARHQTFIRFLSALQPVPSAFETALSPRAVFTLAAPFIKSCPEGSNLKIEPFPPVQLAGGLTAKIGKQLVVQEYAKLHNAQFCAFLNDGATEFAPIQNGVCDLPAGLTGEVYLFITKAEGATDGDILAGPTVLSIS